MAVGAGEEAGASALPHDAGEVRAQRALSVRFRPQVQALLRLSCGSIVLTPRQRGSRGWPFSVAAKPSTRTTRAQHLKVHGLLTE